MNRNTNSPLLDVRDLEIHYRTGEGPVRAVDDMSLSLKPGEAMGLGRHPAQRPPVRRLADRLVVEHPTRSFHHADGAGRVLHLAFA